MQMSGLSCASGGSGHSGPASAPRLGKQEVVGAAGPRSAATSTDAPGQAAAAQSIKTFTLHVPGTNITQDVCMDSGRSVEDLRAVGSSLMGGKRARIVGLPRAYAGLTLGELKLKAPHRLLVVPSPGSGGRPTAVLEGLERVAQQANDEARAEEQRAAHKRRTWEESDEIMGGTTDTHMTAVQQSAALGGGDTATGAYPVDHDDDSTHTGGGSGSTGQRTGGWPPGSGSAEAGQVPTNRIAASLRGSQCNNAKESAVPSGRVSSVWGTGAGSDPKASSGPSATHHERIDTTTTRSLLLRQVHDAHTLGHGVLAAGVPQEFTCALTDVDEEPVLWTDAPAFASRVALRLRTYQGFMRLAPLDPSKKTLVLDIDHTIMDTDLMNSVAVSHLMAKEGSTQGTTTTPSAWRRPHLHEFLTTVYPHYNLVIWSATGNAHVEAKLRDLGCVPAAGSDGPDYKIAILVDYGAMIRVKVSKGRLTRDFNTKPLAVLYGLFGAEARMTPHTTLLVDDHRRSFVMDPSNGIHIQGYRANEENRRCDREFADLARYCLLLRHLPSVRLLNHDNWRAVAQAADSIQVMANQLRPGFTLHVRKSRDRTGSGSFWGAARSDGGRHRSSSSSGQTGAPGPGVAGMQPSKAQASSIRLSGHPSRRSFRVEPIADPLPSEIRLTVRQSGHRKDISDPTQLALLHTGPGSSGAHQPAPLAHQSVQPGGGRGGYLSPSFPAWPGPLTLPPGVLMPGSHTHTVTGIGEIQAPPALYDTHVASCLGDTKALHSSDGGPDGPDGSDGPGGSVSPTPPGGIDEALQGLEATPYTGSEAIGFRPGGLTPAHMYKGVDDELMADASGEAEPWVADAGTRAGPSSFFGASSGTTPSPASSSSALSSGSSAAKGSKATPTLLMPSPDAMLRRFSVLSSPGVLSTRRKSAAGLLAPLASGAAPMSPVAAAAASAGRLVPVAPAAAAVLSPEAKPTLSPKLQAAGGSLSMHSSVESHSRPVPIQQQQQAAAGTVFSAWTAAPSSVSVDARQGQGMEVDEGGSGDVAGEGAEASLETDAAIGTSMPARPPAVPYPTAAFLSQLGRGGDESSTTTPRSLAKLAGTGRLDTVHSGSVGGSAEAASGLGPPVQGMAQEQQGGQMAGVASLNQPASSSLGSASPAAHYPAMQDGGLDRVDGRQDEPTASGQGHRLRRLIGKMLSPFQTAGGSDDRSDTSS